MRHEASVLVHDVRPKWHDLLSLELHIAPCEVCEASLPTLSLMSRVVEEERPHEAAKLARCLRLTESRLVLDERLDCLADRAEEALDLRALRPCVGDDALVERREGSLELKGLCALLRGQFLGHQQREEQGMLGQDVGGETGIGPGMTGGIAVIHLWQNDNLLVGALRGARAGCSSQHIHPTRARHLAIDLRHTDGLLCRRPRWRSRPPSEGVHGTVVAARNRLQVNQAVLLGGPCDGRRVACRPQCDNTQNAAPARKYGVRNAYRTRRSSAA